MDVVDGGARRNVLAVIIKVVSAAMDDVHATRAGRVITCGDETIALALATTAINLAQVRASTRLFGTPPRSRPILLCVLCILAILYLGTRLRARRSDRWLKVT